MFSQKNEVKNTNKTKNAPNVNKELHDHFVQRSYKEMFDLLIRENKELKELINISNSKINYLSKEMQIQKKEIKRLNDNIGNQKKEKIEEKIELKDKYKKAIINKLVDMKYFERIDGSEELRTLKKISTKMALVLYTEWKNDGFFVNSSDDSCLVGSFMTKLLKLKTNSYEGFQPSRLYAYGRNHERSFIDALTKDLDQKWLD